MALAIKLAKQGHYTTSPNPRVGCVFVKNDRVIGQGFHKKAGSGHAEVNALASLTESAEGATAYVTLEPCSHFGRTPPCAKALIDAKVARVVCAMVDPNPQVSGRGINILKAAGIEAQSGLLEQDAKDLNPGFNSVMTEKMPFVRCKMAVSLDGKTAMASGESQWITGTEARTDVQRLRAQSCAVIAGADSIITDNARMTVRHEQLGELAKHYLEQDIRQPVRVVIDTQHRLTPELAFFQEEYPIIIVRTALENEQQWPHFVKQLCVPEYKGKADLTALLSELAKQGLNDVLIEAGATLAGTFIEQNLVDELIVYQAPKLLGADGKSMLAMPDITALKHAKALAFSDITMVGRDIRITARIHKS